MTQSPSWMSSLEFLAQVTGTALSSDSGDAMSSGEESRKPPVRKASHSPTGRELLVEQQDADAADFRPVGRQMNPPGALPSQRAGSGAAKRYSPEGNQRATHFRENPFSSVSLHSSEEKELGPIRVRLQKPEVGRSSIPESQLPASDPGMLQVNSAQPGSAANTLPVPPSPLGTFKYLSQTDAVELHSRLKQLETAQKEGRVPRRLVKSANCSPSTTPPEITNATMKPALSAGSMTTSQAAPSKSYMERRRRSEATTEFHRILESQGVLVQDPPTSSPSSSDQSKRSPSGSNDNIQYYEEEMFGEKNENRLNLRAHFNGAKSRIRAVLRTVARRPQMEVKTGTHRILTEVAASGTQDTAESERKPNSGLMADYIRGFAPAAAVNPMLEAAEKKSAASPGRKSLRNTHSLVSMQTIDLEKHSYESNQECEGKILVERRKSLVEAERKAKAKNDKERFRTALIILAIIGFSVGAASLLTWLGSKHGRFTTYSDNDGDDDGSLLAGENKKNPMTCPGLKVGSDCIIAFHALPERWDLAPELCERLGSELANISRDLRNTQPEFLKNLASYLMEGGRSHHKYWIWFKEQSNPASDSEDGDAAGPTTASTRTCTALSLVPSPTSLSTAPGSPQQPPSLTRLDHQPCSLRLTVLCRFELN